MNTLESKEASDLNLQRAAFAVGMVAHTIVHTKLKSEVRKGSFHSLVELWVESASAPKEIVQRALDRLAKDPHEWDRVGQSSSAIYNKLLAYEAVANVAKQVEEEA